MDKPTITLADIAEHAQVSKMSVSRALNGQAGVSEKTRQRILRLADELGYSLNPNPWARTVQSKLIGLLIPDITTTYTGEILRGISSAAEHLNYGLLLYPLNITDPARRANQYLAFMNDSAIDGVILVGPRDYEVIVTDLKSRDLPYFIIDHHSGTDNEPSVTATNRKGILDAMRHLLALGHQRIGFITGRMDIACSHDRLQGYRDALTEVGLSLDEQLVRIGDYSQPGGFKHGQALLQLEDRPTAIVASNDLMAFGVMDAAKEIRLNVGKDISIVGFDDIHMASQVHPALTTVRQPMAEMGQIALEMLVSIVEERPTLTMRRELPTELIIRESTGRISRT